MGTLAAVEKEAALSVAITPAQMLQVAVEQGADLDKLEKLMDLQDRWEKTQAEKAYFAAMSAFRSECPTINRQQKGYDDRKYAGLAGSLEQINVLLAKNQLSHSWRTAQDGSAITVTCRVTHAGGHSEVTSLSAAPDASGGKNPIQAIGSAVSYLQRYTLFAILGLASREMDDDGVAAHGSDVDIEKWLAAIDDADSTALGDIAAELARTAMPAAQKAKLRAAFAARKHALGESNATA